MPSIPSTPAQLAVARRIVSRGLGISPGHASETIAAALGHRTHAGHLAAIAVGNARLCGPSLVRFDRRLRELSHATDARQAGAVLSVAIGEVPADAGDVRDLRTALDYALHVRAARVRLLVDHPDGMGMILALMPVPDLVTPGLGIGKDILRWNPGALAPLTPSELRFIVAAAAIHRAVLHPIRCGDRDPGVWAMACDYAVHGWLRDRRIGTMPAGCAFAPALGSGMPAEEVYDSLVASGALGWPAAPTFRFEGWKADLPRTLPTVAEAGEALRDRGRGDGRQGHGVGMAVLRDREPAIVAAAGSHPGLSGNPVTDANALAFGTHLAEVLPFLAPAERADALDRAIGRLLDGCTDEVAVAVTRELARDPRVGLDWNGPRQREFAGRHRSLLFG